MSEQPGGFGNELRRAREAAGIGRTELARQVDLNQSYLYRLEAGGRRPSRKTVVALAAALRLGRAETEAWLRAAGHDVTRPTGSSSPIATRGVRTGIPTSGVMLQDAGDIYANQAPTQLEAGLAAIGVDVGAMHRLLDAADTLSGVERRDVAGQLDGAVSRLATAIAAPVRTVLIPVTHPRLGLLAPHVVQQLVVQVIQEAVQGGADHVVLLATDGAVAPWHRSLRAALGIASVPSVDLTMLTTIEMDASAGGSRLELAVLSARGEIKDHPFGLLAPEATPASRPSNATTAGIAFSAFGRLAHIFGQLRTGGDAHLLAVSGRSEGAGSHLSVVTGEEVLPATYRVTRVQPHPESDTGGRRRASLTWPRAAAGRYILGPGILEALQESAPGAGGAPSLANALELLRRGGSQVYATVLPGARRSTTSRLDDLDSLAEEVAPSRAP